MSIIPQEPEDAEVTTPRRFASHRVDIILREQRDVEILRAVFGLECGAGKGSRVAVGLRPSINPSPSSFVSLSQLFVHHANQVRVSGTQMSLNVS